MKRHELKQQSFKALSRVMNNYAAIFNEKPDIQAAREEFDENLEKIRELISQLLRPVSTVRGVKTDSRNRMRKSLWQMLGIGITLAARSNNQPLVETLKKYAAQCRRCPTYHLYEMAQHTHDELSGFQDLAISNGLTQDKLEAFQLQIVEYGKTLDQTGFQLNDRRKGRKDIRDYIKANNILLRTQLDTFVRYAENDHPDLFAEYTFLRKRKDPRAKPGSTEAELIEITGTVTDSITGLPVPNATISITDYSLVESTDSDGYYSLEDLAAGSYQILCSAVGYTVPNAISVTASDGENLVVDFTVVPAAAIENPAA